MNRLPNFSGILQLLLGVYKKKKNCKREEHADRINNFKRIFLKLKRDIKIKSQA